MTIPRTRIVIADGTKFVAETDDRFDVIMVDSTDPVGPGAVLFTARVLCRLPALPEARRPPRHPERAAFPAGGASSSRAWASSASCSPTPSPISPPRRPISAGPCPMAGRPTMPSSAHHKRKKIERRYEKAGAFPTRYWTPRRPCRRLCAADLCPRAGRRLMLKPRPSFGRSPTSGRQ